MAKRKPSTNSKNHYVDNDRLCEELTVYKKAVDEWKSNNEEGPKPPVPHYVGKALLLIAQRVSFMKNFASYTYKEEMISDSIENCLKYIDNFDPSISKKPFSYFTQIIHFAFLRRIEREQKQQYIKYKTIEDHRLHTDDYDINAVLDNFGTDDFNQHMKEFIDDFESKKEEKKRKAKARKQGLEIMMDDEDEEEAPLTKAEKKALNAKEEKKRLERLEKHKETVARLEERHNKS